MGSLEVQGFEQLLEYERPRIEKVKEVYFVPPRDMYDFLVMRAVLAGYGAIVRYKYSVRHGDYYRTKLFVSVPESIDGVVKSIIRKFGGRIREEEILTTHHYRGVTVVRESAIGLPIGVTNAGWFIGVELPSRVVIAGDEAASIALMKYLLVQYYLELGGCCFVLGKRGRGVGGVSNTIPIADVAAVSKLAEALARMYNMSQNASGIASILLRQLGVVVPNEDAGEETDLMVGREAEVVEWLLNSVRFGGFREDVLTYDISDLSEGHKVVISVYLMNITFPFIYGVGDNFFDYARHSSSPRFVYYSPITNVDRLYSKSQANYIVVLTRNRASLYMPYDVAGERGFAEVGFVPLWRLLRG